MYTFVCRPLTKPLRPVATPELKLSIILATVYVYYRPVAMMSTMSIHCPTQNVYYVFLMAP